MIQSFLARWLRLATAAWWKYCVCFSPMTVRAVQLRQREVLTLQKSSGVQFIQLRGGTVWITGTPANRDVVLRSNELFPLENNWPFVIEALTDAEINLK